jgi:hypothetical protein
VLQSFEELFSSQPAVSQFFYPVHHPEVGFYYHLIDFILGSI